MLHRMLSVLATAAASLALTASPALAQDDDDDDDGSGQTVPEGGVQKGAGGTAEQGPDLALAGVAAGSPMLVAGAGGVVLRRRETS